jgi:hypothetical protein
METCASMTVPKGIRGEIYDLHSSAQLVLRLAHDSAGVAFLTGLTDWGSHDITVTIPHPCNTVAPAIDTS